MAETLPQHSNERRKTLQFGKYDYPLSRYDEGAQVVVNIDGRWQTATIVNNNAEVQADGKLHMEVQPEVGGVVTKDFVFDEAPRVVDFPGVTSGPVNLPRHESKKERLVLREDGLFITPDGRVEYNVRREMIDDHGGVVIEEINGVPQDLLTSYRDLIETNNRFDSLAATIDASILPAHRAKLREVRLDIAKMMHQVYEALPHVAAMASKDKGAVGELKKKLDTKIKESQAVMRKMEINIAEAKGESAQHEKGVEEVAYHPETSREILERLRFARDAKKGINEAVARHKQELEDIKKQKAEERERKIEAEKVRVEAQNLANTKKFNRDKARFDKADAEFKLNLLRRKAKQAEVERAEKALDKMGVNLGKYWDRYESNYLRFYGQNPMSRRDKRPPKDRPDPTKPEPSPKIELTADQQDILNRGWDLIVDTDLKEKALQTNYDQKLAERDAISDEPPEGVAKPETVVALKTLPPDEEERYQVEKAELEEKLTAFNDNAIFEIIKDLEAKVVAGTATEQERALVEALQRERLAAAEKASGPDMVGVDAAGVPVTGGATPDHFDYKADGPVAFGTPRAQKNKELLTKLLDNWESAAEPLRDEAVVETAETFHWELHSEELVQALAKATDEIPKDGNLPMPRYAATFADLERQKAQIIMKQKFWSSPKKALKDPEFATFAVPFVTAGRDLNSPEVLKDVLDEIRVDFLVKGWNQLSTLEQRIMEAGGHKKDQNEGSKEGYDHEHLNIDSRTLQEILGPQVADMQAVWRAMLLDEEGITKDEQQNDSVMNEVILTRFRNMVPASQPGSGVLFQERLRRAGIKDWGEFKTAWDRKFARQYAVEMYKIVHESLKTDLARLTTVLQKLGANHEATIVQSIVTGLAVGGGALLMSSSVGRLAGVLGSMGGEVLNRLVQATAGGVGGAVGGLIKTYANEKIGGNIEKQKHAFHDQAPDKRGKGQIRDIGGRAAHREEEMEEHRREEFVDRYVGAMFANPFADQAEATVQQRVWYAPWRRRDVVTTEVMSGGVVKTSEMLAQIMRTLRGNEQKGKLDKAVFGEQVQNLTGAQVVELEGILNRAERTKVDAQTVQGLVGSLQEMRGGTDMLTLRMFGEHPKEINTLSESNRENYIQVLLRVGNLDIPLEYKKAVIDFITGKPLTEKLTTPEGEETAFAFTVDDLLKKIRTEVGSDAGRVEMVDKYLAMYAGKGGKDGYKKAAAVNATAGFALAAGRFGGGVFGAAMLGKVGWESGERRFLQSEREISRRRLSGRMQELRDARDNIGAVFYNPEQLTHVRELTRELMRVMHGTGSEDDMIGIFEFKTTVERDKHGHIVNDKNGKPFRKAMPMVDLVTITELQSLLHEVRDTGLFLENPNHRQSLTSSLDAMTALSREVKEKSTRDKEEWVRFLGFAITHGERRSLKGLAYKLAGGVIGAGTGAGIGFAMGHLFREFVSLQHGTFGGEIGTDQNLSDIDIHDYPTTPEGFAEWLKQAHPDQEATPEEIEHFYRREGLTAEPITRRGLDIPDVETGSALDDFANTHDLGPHGKDVLGRLVDRYPELNNPDDLQTIMDASHNTSGHVETTLASRDLAITKCLLGHGNTDAARDFIDNYVNAHGLGDEKIIALGGLDKILENVAAGKGSGDILKMFHAVEGTNLQQGQGPLPEGVDEGSFGVKGVAYAGHDGNVHDIGTAKGDYVFGIHEHSLATGSGDQQLFTHPPKVETISSGNLEVRELTNDQGTKMEYVSDPGKTFLFKGHTVEPFYDPVTGNYAHVGMDTDTGELIKITGKLPGDIPTHLDIPKGGVATGAAVGIESLRPGSAFKNFGGGGRAEAIDPGVRVTGDRIEIMANSLGKVGDTEMFLGSGADRNLANQIMKGLNAERVAATELYYNNMGGPQEGATIANLRAVNARIAEFAENVRIGKIDHFPMETRTSAQIVKDYQTNLMDAEFLKEAPGFKGANTAPEIDATRGGEPALETGPQASNDIPGFVENRLASLETSGKSATSFVKDVLAKFDDWRSTHAGVVDKLAMQDFLDKLNPEGRVALAEVSDGSLAANGHAVKASIDGTEHFIYKGNYKFSLDDDGQLIGKKAGGEAELMKVAIVDDVAKVVPIESEIDNRMAA
ncbi:MAG: hypothetical protein US42_C0016G0024 [Candidatus Magasanikbacteria bacterium GW2011_GWC2_37_14]|uniref:Uncharacterized protein n=1 Tax=Candidatus Magasanikbacteria bacterium GW2011_GWC2_37_14 TaxID=1619046 RepID=A0A0G0IS89_9BACT|nr:MAG: hypothetical protein US42_C0016G0024 [Candidatus Magasanikbacteria bacterium GW2011_GWC2_37_14]